MIRQLKDFDKITFHVFIIVLKILSFHLRQHRRMNIIFFYVFLHLNQSFWAHQSVKLIVAFFLTSNRHITYECSFLARNFLIDQKIMPIESRKKYFCRAFSLSFYFSLCFQFSLPKKWFHWELWNVCKSFAIWGWKEKKNIKKKVPTIKVYGAERSSQSKLLILPKKRKYYRQF